MSKKTERDQLSRELAVMPEVVGDLDFADNDGAVILARVIKGLSCDAWRQACKPYTLARWHALPVRIGESGEEEQTLLTGDNGSLPVSPFREAQGALTRPVFIELLRRELMRISRNGGNLSIIAATISNRDDTETALGRQAASKLDSLLGATLLSRMDICDSLGLARKGVYACSLPGLGQLAARNFAEKASSAFEEAAQPYFPAGGLSAGKGCGCAMGIVNIMQGEATTAENLLTRARSALETALRKQGAQIHQESAFTPFEGTTLVHSSEKRFLFFGGDPE